MIKFLLALVLFIVCSNSLIGQTAYYVASSGNNANNGSLATPFKTIQYAVDKAIAGDIISVQ